MDNVQKAEPITAERLVKRDFDLHVRSSRPLIYIVSHEESRVIDGIRFVANTANRLWHVVTWDVHKGLKLLDSESKETNSDMSSIKDQIAVLKWFEEQPEPKNNKYLVLVLKDFHAFMGYNGQTGQIEEEVIRTLYNLAEDNITKHKVIVFISPVLHLPTRLERICAVIDWPLPERFYIEKHFNSILSLIQKNPELNSFNKNYSTNEKDSIISACQGLTMKEIELLMSYNINISVNGGFDSVFLANKKRDIIRKAGLIDWIEVDTGMESVGGLKELKKWLAKRKRAFTEDAKAYGLPENPKGLLLVGVQGGGKCFKKDTPILMYNGNIKNVQDIEVGDTVMGHDSTPREVLTLHSGTSPMYEIKPRKGDSYVVNENHILCLKLSGNPNKKKTYKEFDNNRELCISIKEYLSKSKIFKKNAMGYSVGVEYDHVNVPLDPYYLGLWIGDGNSKFPSITTQDVEILEYLERFASSYNMHIRTAKKKDNKSSAHYITYGNIGINYNPVTEILKKLNLISNKHIPQIYKINSSQIRLNVLAGLIDSDGYLSAKNGYTIAQKNDTIANDIVYLARSLGFLVTIKKKISSWTWKGIKRFGEYNYIQIEGDTDRIPCKIEYKKAQPRITKRNPLYHSLEVNYCGIDQYYGFETNGDHKFLLGDFTVVHNSLSAKSIAKYWGLPLLRLDMGKVFAGIVGSSEQNIRHVIRIAESVSPCILWCDELDKACSGVASSNTTDGGTAARVFGTFLTWMQEKTAPVYVVATANDISQLPPELLRKGRFDEIFFIDLPQKEDRAEILRIHLEKRKRDVSNFNITQLVKSSESFTGAEIEAGIIAAMYEAFNRNEEVTTDDVEFAFNEMIPIAVTMKEDITGLRKWAENRARNASYLKQHNRTLIDTEKEELMKPIIAENISMISSNDNDEL